MDCENAVVSNETIANKFERVFSLNNLPKDLQLVLLPTCPMSGRFSCIAPLDMRTAELESVECSLTYSNVFSFRSLSYKMSTLLKLHELNH